MRPVLLLLFLAGGALGCSSDPATEIELVVESRIAEVDRIRVDVIHPDGDTSTSMADLTLTPGPRRLRLAHRGGELGPVSLEILGLAGGREVVATTRVLSFLPDRSVRLEVVLAEACSELDCGADTCGNDGVCRAPEVRECELAVGGCAPVDAGPEDAGPLDGGVRDAEPADAGTEDGGPTDAGPSDAAPDGGPCAGFRVCGVSSIHLPGDGVRPRTCSVTSDEVRVAVFEGGVSLPVFGGVAQVVRPGPHRATVSTDVCDAEVSFFVSGPTAYDFVDEPGTLNELAGRVDSAVLATSDGAFAIGERSAVRIVGDGVSDVHRNFSRAVYTSSGAWFGAAGGHRAYVYVPVPLGATVAVEHPLDTVTGALGMALPHRSETPVLYASAQGPVLLGAPGDTGSRLDTRGITWMVMGTLSGPGRGAVWAGNGSSLRNLPLDGATVAFNGEVVNIDGDVTTVQTVALDERAGVTSLWMCGREVHRYDVEGDLSAATELPAPAVVVEEDCVDLALGDDGEVWVAQRFGGVLRLRRDGTEALRYTAPQGLIGASAMFRLDFASDSSGRALWLLSRPHRAVIRFSADAFAP
ncbi:MAG: hypothetical protein AB8I08_36445 [Sandaracinaceae bacterium]